MIKLSDRLQMIADEIKKGETVADIGTDHGLLPIFLYESGRSPRVILGDINKGPLEKARENIALHFGADALDDDGSRYIGIDKTVQDGGAAERVHMIHEIGHCVTGSFYNRYAAVDSRQRHENRADKWAIKKLVPVDELDTAIAEGCTEVWELAERFGVTEEFIRKAVCYYVHGNLATELYF